MFSPLIVQQAILGLSIPTPFLNLHPYNATSLHLLLPLMDYDEGAMASWENK